jgi:phospholipase/carboxylesterase
VGVLHADNEREERGGCSLYVPETWDGRTPMPLVVALHGGHGHGRDFLWTWLRDAAQRGALVLAPTSLDRTWSLMGEDVDAEPLHGIVGARRRALPGRPRADAADGHVGRRHVRAPVRRAGRHPVHAPGPALRGVHPMLVADGGLERLRDRPVYHVHGALDWMFPIATAHLGRDLLQEAGARWSTASWPTSRTPTRATRTRRSWTGCWPSCRRLRSALRTISPWTSSPCSR